MPTCSDPLPDFTNFSYSLVNPPEPAKGLGWDKLKECERRLALYRWAERLNAPLEGTHYLGRPPQQVFLDDCLSAFLMTFKAALQFTGESLEHSGAIPDRGFSSWLRKRRAYDRYMRGLRTLRHFAAHVEMKPVKWGFVIIAHARDWTVIAGSHQATEPPVTESPGGYRWTLPQLTRADLEKLDTPELNFKAFRAAKLPRNLKDLRAWNKLVFMHKAETILEHGLRQAQVILLAAEKLL